jgi:integral membrane protein (TIGR01906 family)
MMVRRIAQITLAALVPLLLVALSARAVMTPLFLSIEYQRPGFPADPYGLTTEQRLRYAPLALTFLIEGRPTGYLADLTFNDGRALFNIRELGHMADVQIVTQSIFGLAWIAAAVVAACALFLALRDPNALARALRTGSLLAIGLVAAVAVSAVVAWDTFFTAFHQLFFAGGTWVFAYSDTLIRLFPEQFWFDAALTVGVLTILGALALLALASAIGRVKRA